MLYVVMKDGRVLKYNEPTNVNFTDDFVSLVNPKNEWYAQIRSELIERIDFVRPCSILKESRDKKKMKKYGG